MPFKNFLLGEAWERFSFSFHVFNCKLREGVLIPSINIVGSVRQRMNCRGRGGGADLRTDLTRWNPTSETLSSPFSSLPPPRDHLSWELWIKVKVDGQTGKDGLLTIPSYCRKRGSASYTVREVRTVREREIQRETDGSDVTIFALKLAMSL